MGKEIEKKNKFSVAEIIGTVTMVLTLVSFIFGLDNLAHEAGVFSRYNINWKFIEGNGENGFILDTCKNLIIMLIVSIIFLCVFYNSKTTKSKICRGTIFSVALAILFYFGVYFTIKNEVDGIKEYILSVIPLVQVHLLLLTTFGSVTFMLYTFISVIKEAIPELKNIFKEEKMYENFIANFKRNGKGAIFGVLCLIMIPLTTFVFGYIEYQYSPINICKYDGKEYVFIADYKSKYILVECENRKNEKITIYNDKYLLVAPTKIEISPIKFEQIDFV